MRIARILTTRWAICLFNGIILMITMSTLYQASKLLFNVTNDFDQIEGLLDGISVIFVAYGVALEERDSLMKFFELYPKYWTDVEEAIDHFSHFYGLCILLLGLFMEVSVEVVKIPNTVLNTEGIEGVVFGVGFLFLVLASVLLLRLSYVLLRVRKFESKAVRES
jgi:hypothetical protein